MVNNTCDWTLVISALAVSIPGLIGALVLWIKAKAEFEYIRIRQYEIKNDIQAVKAEQANVKDALNNTNGAK